MRIILIMTKILTTILAYYLYNFNSFYWHILGYSTVSSILSISPQVAKFHSSLFVLVSFIHSSTQCVFAPMFTVGNIVDKCIYTLHLPFLMPKDLQYAKLEATVFLQTLILPPDKFTYKRREQLESATLCSPGTTICVQRIARSCRTGDWTSLYSPLIISVISELCGS